MLFLIKPDYLLILVFLINGLTTILLSRTKTYLFKNIMDDLFSWPLTIFFGIESFGVFYILSALSVTKNVHGEEALGWAILSVFLGVFVSITSLVVNIKEKKGVFTKKISLYS